MMRDADALLILTTRPARAGGQVQTSPASGSRHLDDAGRVHHQFVRHTDLECSNARPGGVSVHSSVRPPNPVPLDPCLLRAAGRPATRTRHMRLSLPALGDKSRSICSAAVQVQADGFLGWIPGKQKKKSQNLGIRTGQTGTRHATGSAAGSPRAGP